MIFLPLLLFVVLLIMLSSRHRHALHAIDALQATVKSITTAVLSNDLARLNTPPPTTTAAACSFVQTLTQKHLYRGELHADHLQLLQQVIATTREQIHGRGQLHLLFLARSGGVIVFSMLGNIFLSHFVVAAPPLFYVPLSAAAVLLAGVWLLAKTMPQPWFWYKHKLSSTGQRWLTTLFDPREHSLHPTLQQLQQREITLGIDLSRERYAFLKHWPQERQDEEQTALRRQQDFVPLLEIVVFGTLAALQLSPVLRSLWMLFGD